MLRKLLLTPLRFAVGWGLYPRMIGWVGVCMLVLLRITIGWHFYTEGVEKYSAGNWDAKPFFANASGPVADHFHNLVWDADGAIRLQTIPTDRNPYAIDGTYADNSFKSFRNRVIQHYGFNDAQKKQANANYLMAKEQLEEILTTNAGEIKEFKLGKSRVAELERDPMRDGVDSLGGQRATIRKEWQQKIAPVFKQIDAVWTTYEAAQNNLATLKQAAARSPLKLDVPHTQPMDTVLINQIVPYFDIAIGVCLLLGLFTPVAALAAAGFLGSVFLSQYPPATGPSSTMYQLIEGIACLTLAGTGAGRFAGLDFLLHTIFRKLWPHVEGK